MPIFSRRRIQAMLDEIRPLLDDPSKYKDLVRRLNSEAANQALPAETELSLLWALSKIGSIEIEPERFGGSRLPDAYCETLFLDGRGAFVEITALEDGRLSGEELMRAVSSKIRDTANSISRGAGEHLHFTFHEEWGSHSGKKIRRRKVSPDFMVTPALRDQLAGWLADGNAANKFRYTDEFVDVTLERRKNRPHRLFNFFSSMPPVAQSLTDNPLYEALCRKRSQLRGLALNERRVLFVSDRGSTLLRNVGGIRWPDAISGEDIIRHFLRIDDVIDVICVLSPKRQSTNPIDPRFRSIAWKLSLFSKSTCVDLINQDAFDAIRRHLPVPRFGGYQANSLQLQRLYSPKARGWYHAVSFSYNNMEGEMRISARAFLDLLAGRISYETFCHLTGLTQQENMFRKLLDSGNVVSSISFHPSGIDEDDDEIVIHFKRDASASDYE